MAASGDRSFRLVLAVCGAVAITGIGIAAWGIATPIYSVDAGVALQAQLAWCSDAGKIDHAAGERYRALFTNHYLLKNVGTGLILAAASIAALATILRVNTLPGEPWLRTPRSRWSFLAIGLGILALGHCGTIASFWTDLYRHYLPSCADSIGIPISASTMLAELIVLPLLLIGAGLTLLFGGLPASLMQWDRERPARSWIVTIIFGLLMALITVVALASLLETTNLWEPPLVVAFYLLASTRAALIAPRSIPAENPVVA